MNFSKITIITDRLFIVPVSLQYKEEIFKEFTPDVTYFMYPKSPKEIEETEEYIKSSQEKIKEGSDLNLTILKKDTHEFLGGCGLHQLKTKVLKFGIWIKEDAHGNKYGAEAISGLKKWAEDNLDFDYFIYPVDINNIPSRKIAESLGGIVHKEYKQKSLSGRVLDEVEYRIEKSN